MLKLEYNPISQKFDWVQNLQAITENIIPLNDNANGLGSAYKNFKELFVGKVYIKDGIATQFLKADGSLDSNTYLTSFTETDPVAMSYINQSVKTTASPSFAGLTLTGALARGANAITGTGNVGATNGYVSNIYNTRHYFNSTAYIDGETAGKLTNYGTVFANAISDVNGAGIPFEFGVQGQTLKTIFLAVGSVGTHNVWAQSQWNANVTSTSGQFDSNYPGVQMLLGLGTNYGANGSVSLYTHPANDFSKIYNFFATADTGTVLGNQLGAYYPRVATARLDIYTEVASKIGVIIKPFTSQSADILRIYNPSDGTGTTYITKVNANGSFSVGLAARTPSARLETYTDGADYLTADKTANQINWGNNSWAGFYQRTCGVNHPTYTTSELSSFVIVERSRGTVASPAVPQSGDRLGAYIFGGWINSSWNRQTARIYVEAAENWGYTNPNYQIGSKMVFTTTLNGNRTTLPGDVERMSIGNDGTIIVNETGLATADFRIEGDTDANLFFTDASADKVGVGTNSPTQKFSVNETSGMTLEGGYAIKLIAGEALYKGEIVYMDISGVDLKVKKNPIDGDMPIGVVHADAANDAAVWIIVSGVAEVLPDSSVTATRGYVIYSSSTTAGRVEQAATVPAVTQHFREVGHFIATGSGNGALTKAIIHFN